MKLVPVYIGRKQNAQTELQLQEKAAARFARPEIDGPYLSICPELIAILCPDHGRTWPHNNFFGSPLRSLESTAAAPAVCDGKNEEVRRTSLTMIKPELKSQVKSPVIFRKLFRRSEDPTIV